MSLVGLKNSVTNSDKPRKPPGQTAAVIPVDTGDLTVGGSCDWSGLADMNGDGGKLDEGLPLQNHGKSKWKLQIRPTDRQTDRCLIARAPLNSCGGITAGY